VTTASADGAPLAGAPRRRRGGIVAVVVIAIVAALLVVAAIVAEMLARDAVGDEISQRVAGAVGGDPAETEVDLGAGLILPQLLAGRLDDVRVATSAELGGLAADLVIRAGGVPLEAGGEVRRLDVEASIPAASIETIADQLGEPLSGASVALDGDAIVASGEVDVLSIAVPLQLGLVPSAVDGAISLEPVSARVDSVDVPLAELREGPLSGLAERILAPREVCIADRMPAAFSLDSAEVRGDALVLGLSGDGATLASGAPTGTCG
jgi:hypothetical protein